MPPQVISAAEAAALVPDQGFVYVAGNAATPRALVRALAEREAEVSDVRIGHVLMLGRDPFADPTGLDHLRHHAWFVGPADRDAVNRGQADYVPIHLHQIPRAITSGPPIDVAMVSTSPPDRHGHMSLGVEVLATRAAVARAKVVVAQVNPAVPRVLGDSFLSQHDVDYIVECEEPLPELVPPPATEAQRAIARHIAPLVPDGATLQLGIGGVPDAVLALLVGQRSDLGIHTEMISDGLLPAIASGTVTGRAKTLHAGKVIVTFALGTRGLYDFISDNPLVEAYPVEYVNNPRVIAQNDRMVAINSALSIDLTGQVCSDSIGCRIYSGFGGQVDFLRGAAASKGGVPIIAMPSTAQKGKVSRIVPMLAPGSGVVTSRADVHWVVTEFGAVNLFGKDLRTRGEALISIAHPDFRDELTAAMRTRWR